MNMRYPVEQLDDLNEDDGTMPENVAKLAENVVGRRIVSVDREKYEGDSWRAIDAFTLTLDDGTKVQLADSSDCCAYTDLEGFFAHPEMVDHVITGVGTTEGYTKWHIYADMGDVLTLDVDWSCGNPFYYAYGFNIAVVPAEAEKSVSAKNAK